MAKIKNVFVCQSCGAQSPKWMGRCNTCGEWNTMVEEVQHKAPVSPGLTSKASTSKPLKINEITTTNESRVNTGISELNRVLGGGMVEGSIVLFGGEPGIGKSTLALQMALCCHHLNTLYISGEESLQQIKLRSQRLNIENDTCYLLSETNLDVILQHMRNHNPNMVIIDSIQTLHDQKMDSSPGTISQVRECTMQLLHYAKQNNVPVVLIGHINKDGNLAGPKVLEHIVDTVLQFEGDNQHMYRILRSTKNRFGSTSELGIFEMTDKGLKEILNPSEILLNHYEDQLSGISIGATLDGVRPFLIEVQALVSTAAYGTPQRSTTGFDTRRLNMLLAVLEKRAGFHISSKDVFLNIAGGIKVNDPAIDLAVLAAILSSSMDLSIDQKTCFAGEVGLSGEIRPITRIEQRIIEAERLGFNRIFISKYNKKGVDLKKNKIEVISVTKLEDVFKKVFKPNH